MSSYCKKHGTELLFSTLSGVGYCDICEKEKEEKYKRLKKDAEVNPSAVKQFTDFLDNELSLRRENVG